MNSADEIRRLFNSAAVQTNATPDDAVFETLKTAYTKTVERRPAQREPRMWTFVMKSPLAKFAVTAAAVAIIVLLPLGYGATKLIRGFISIRQLPPITLDFPDGGALSPNGKHFAGLTRDSELVVVDTSTGEQRKLAENCGGRVVWSADGSEIAVIKMNLEGEKNTLIAVSLQTGQIRTLMEDPPYHIEDWSPDGKLMLFRKSSK